MQSDEQAIRDLIAAWLSASKAEDTQKVLTLMAEDVVFLQAGQPPMRGRSAFKAAQDKLGNVDIDATADIQEIKVIGDWAYCWNHLTVTVTPPGGKSVKRTGHVLSILCREGGRWQIFRDANTLAAATD